MARHTSQVGLCSMGDHGDQSQGPSAKVPQPRASTKGPTLGEASSQPSPPEVVMLVNVEQPALRKEKGLLCHLCHTKTMSSNQPNLHFYFGMPSDLINTFLSSYLPFHPVLNLLFHFAFILKSHFLDFIDTI